ncbi:collagen binding domain-containing protein [Schumannella sp. 10F1B-5-1]|uniref:MSCRAMM family protein n=1 Tax=Schumannella sp. 10F1B-5-1 TaxID=2590780 RepID=UPI00112FEE0D|nr:carboxypeptidase-like regulatory domain-containing protein [Schumannella sp. 10F1B-5-1]TPW73445.1 carboxypeptidase regulatory-like domain-containing protein [Schumannella sp. 10F1B-5-1]
MPRTSRLLSVAVAGVAALSLALAPAVVAVAAPTGFVALTLTGSGAPVPGSMVTLRVNGSIDQTQFTDPDGLLTFTGVPAGQIDLDAGADRQGWTPQRSTVDVVADATSQVSIDLVPSPDFVVTGLVTGPDGAPLVGASVTLTAPWDGIYDSWGTQTDESGRYRLDGIWTPVAQLMVTPVDAALVPFSQTIDTTVGGRDVQLAAAATGTARLSGRLVDRATGEPIEGASVSVGAMSANGGWFSRSATTTADGRYDLTALPAGEYSINVWVPVLPGETPWTPYSSRITLADGQDRARDISIKRVRTGTASISGHLRDDAGNPLPNVWMSLAGAFSSVTTDAEGAYTIPNLVAGRYTVVVGSIGERFKPLDWATSAVTVPTDSSAVERDFTLTRWPVGQRTVSGVVTDDRTGAAVAGAQVGLYPVESGTAPYRNTTADPNGRWSFTDVAAGDYRVSVNAPNGGGNWAWSAPSDVVTVGATDVTLPLHLTSVVAGVGGVQGRVVDADTHLPIAGVELAATRSQGGWNAQTTSDAQGRYALAQLPAGEYYLSAQSDGRQVRGGGVQVSIADRVERVSIPMIAAPSQVGGDGLAEVSVVDAAGDPITGASVWVTTPRGDWVATNGSSSDSDGLVELANLPVGEELIVHSRSGWMGGNDLVGSARLTVAPGDAATALTLTLAASSTIAGAVDAAGVEGDLIVAALSGDGSILGTSAVEDDGTYRIVGLEPGSYRVMLTGDSLRFSGEAGEAISDELVAGQRFWSSSSVTGVAAISDADAVPVTADEVSLGHDFRAVLGGTIATTVRVSTGDGVADLPAGKFLRVAVFERLGATWSERTDSETWVAATSGGQLLVRALPDGDYKLRIEDSVQGNRALATVWNGGAASRSAAAVIHVTGGHVTRPDTTVMEVARPGDDPEAIDLDDYDGEVVAGLEGGVDAPASVSEGQKVSVDVGTEFAGEWVAVWANSTPTLAADWVQVQADGTVAVRVPAGLTSQGSQHRLVVQDADQTAIGWAPVTVSATPGGGSLPGSGGGTIPGSVGDGSSAAPVGGGIGATAASARASRLAATGVEGSGDLALAALATAVLGAALLIMGRRRRRSARV